MSKREAPGDVLQKFVIAISASLIAPFRENQKKLALQRELRESKRFIELDTKIGDYQNLYERFRDNFTIRDKVLDVLRALHDTRMAQFLADGKLMSPEESEALKTTLAPYFSLLEPVRDIKRLQMTLMNQAKLKKLPLPYDEINAKLVEVEALAERMPQILMEGVSDLSEEMEKAA